MTASITWLRDLPAAQWDAAVSNLGGHPLQTALWGEARQRADGVESSSYAALVDGEVVWAARVESRRIPFVGKVAWVPKGPCSRGGRLAADCEDQWLALLRQEGFLLCVVDPWKEVEGAEDAGDSSLSRRPSTIWIDLSIGAERLWAGLDMQWRYGVGRARRTGVRVDSTRDPRDIDDFYAICVGVGRAKRFRLPVTRQVLGEVLSQPANGDREARLFVARLDNCVASGALVLRCGQSIHYFMGATDRERSRSRPAEATQWAVIEWALERGCLRYDLEGIDPQANRGVYAFKKKMGGREVALCGTRVRTLGVRGSILKLLRDALPTHGAARWFAR